MPMTIIAGPEEELKITRDEIDSVYYNLSYDIEKRNKATEVRKKESNKLNYEISFGAFSDEYTKLSKEKFIEKAKAIFASLKERDIPFHHIEIRAMDENENVQKLDFYKNSTEEELIKGYSTYK